MQPSSSVSGPSLYELITADGSNLHHEVIAIELQRTATGALGFMFGLDPYDRPLVKHVEPDVAVKKRDRHLSYLILGSQSRL